LESKCAAKDVRHHNLQNLAALVELAGELAPLELADVELAARAVLYTNIATRNIQAERYVDVN
jgi:hypothetical protein